MLKLNCWKIVFSSLLLPSKFIIIYFKYFSISYITSFFWLNKFKVTFLCDGKDVLEMLRTLFSYPRNDVIKQSNSPTFHSKKNKNVAEEKTFFHEIIQNFLEIKARRKDLSHWPTGVRTLLTKKLDLWLLTQLLNFKVKFTFHWIVRFATIISGRVSCIRGYFVEVIELV